MSSPDGCLNMSHREAYIEVQHNHAHQHEHVTIYLGLDKPGTIVAVSVLGHLR